MVKMVSACFFKYSPHDVAIESESGISKPNQPDAFGISFSCDGWHFPGLALGWCGEYGYNKNRIYLINLFYLILEPMSHKDLEGKPMNRIWYHPLTITTNSQELQVELRGGG